MFSDLPQMSALLAQSDGLPIGKALFGAVFFGGVAIFSLFGLFASNEDLKQLAGIIGTENPRTARVVCGLGAVVGAVFAVVSALALTGSLS